MDNERTLRDRLVGNRYFNQEIEETCTVIDVQEKAGLALLQYSDGTFWDEGIGPQMFSEEVQELMGLSEGGIDNERYIQLKSGPRLEDACSEEEHKWFPKPSELWDAAEDMYTEYGRVVRCKKCGLSGAVVADVLGHSYPDMCARCDEDVLPGSSRMHFNAHPEWRDQVLCGDCNEEVEYSVDDYECYKCGGELEESDLWDKVAKRAFDEEPVEEPESVFACEECRQSLFEEIKEERNRSS